MDEEAIDPTTWYLDEDEDGYGVDDDSVTACNAPTGYTDAPGDCDDARDDINPGAVDDLCSGVPALLHGGRGDSGNRFISAHHQCQVADHEQLGMVWKGQIR